MTTYKLCQPIWHSITCICGRCLYMDKQFIGIFAEPLPNQEYFPTFKDAA